METAYETLKKKIDRDDLIILDGGVGTELQFRGIEMDETWCGSASLNTQVLEQIHLAVSYTHLTLPTIYSV